MINKVGGLLKPKRLFQEEEIDSIEDIFRSQIRIDSEVEQMKLQLWERDDFDLEAVLDYFGPIREEGLSAGKMEDVLKTLKIKPMGLNLFYDQYNRERDGLLSIKDIQEMFKPKMFYAPPRGAKKSPSFEVSVKFHSI